MDENSESKSTTATPPPHAPGPKRWWQWLLVYPALVIALLGAVPTFMEAAKSFSLGVPFGRSYDAREQNRLWQENFECAQKANFATTTNRKKVEIGSVVCESGDVLLRGKRPEWDQPQLRWVSWGEVVPTTSAKTNVSVGVPDLITPAAASDALPRETGLAQHPGGPVICQRWLGNGQLLQRINTAQGCFDQIINTYNGWVISNHPAPCNPSC